MKPAQLASRINVIPILLFIIFSSGIIATGFFNFRFHKDRIINEKRSELASITALKSDQIGFWLSERLGDARVIKDNIFLTEQIAGLFNASNKPYGNKIEALMYQFVDNYDYRHAYLLDEKGNVRLSVPQGISQGYSLPDSIRKQFIDYPKIRFLSGSDTDRQVRIKLSLWVPIQVNSNKQAKVIGAFVLEVNPSRILLPLVKSSLPAEQEIETFLLEFRNDKLVCLNKNPDTKNKSGKGSFEKALRTAVKKKGTAGTFDALDFNEKPSVVSYEKIEGLPWYLVATSSKKNINAALDTQFKLTALIVGFFILLAGSLISLWWWNHRILYYQRLYKAELEHKSLIKKYEFLVKFAYDIIILTDKNLKIIEFNYRALEVFGYSREEMNKMSILDLHPAEALTEISEKISILNIEQAIFFETLHRRKDGSVFSIEFSARIFEIDEEKYYQFIGRDISDRRRVEEELQRMFNLVPSMITLASSDGYFKRLNPAWERTLGYDIETLLSKPYTEFIHPDDVHITMAAVEKQFAGQEASNYINRYRAKDGSYKWLEWVTNLSPNGEMIFAVAKDITARKLAEDERETMMQLLRLLNSRSDLQTLAQSVLLFLREVSSCEAIGLRLKDGEDFPFYKTLGFKAEFITDENCSVVRKLIKDINEKQDEKLSSKCYCGDVIFRSFDPSGSNYTSYGSFWVNSLSESETGFAGDQKRKGRLGVCRETGYESIALIPLQFGGEIFGQIHIVDSHKNRFSLHLITFLEKLCENISIAISQRISQNELMKSNVQIQRINDELMAAKQKAEESDRLKSAFLANMSHEIRTPMNAIIGFTEILQKPDLPAEKKERYGRLIKQRSRDLLRIIEDVLDISKIEVGQMKVIQSEVNLSLLLNEIFEYYKLKVEKNDKTPDLTLKVSLAYELRNVRLKTDSVRLKQIINNLLDNAFKFTTKGLIEFGCEPASDPRKILFFVKDTGIGIPREKQKLVFDPFRQAEDLILTRQYGGVGLGLSIVKGVVELMNGEIWLESERNKGTKFFFTLPYTTAPKAVESVLPLPEIKTLSWKGKSILIVEDDEANSLYLNEILSGYDLVIFNAFNGEEALQLINDNPNVDLVLMDIRLPDTNGLILTRLIKVSRPQTVVVAQTAYASHEDVEECLRAGCNDYIAKPINERKLFDLIRHYLESN